MAAGSVRPQDLCPLHIPLICEVFKKYGPNTRYQYHSVLRTLLRNLALDFGAQPGLERGVPHLDPPDPRGVTVSDEEKAQLLAGANPSLRCFILLCSDLAIRSGTAVTISPQNYDKALGTLSFRTKKGRAVTLPVTSELASIFAAASRCPAQMPYCSFLSTRKTSGQSSQQQTFRRLCKTLGIDRHFTPHDLRRTTAVTVMNQTHDIRQVQATLGHRRLSSTIHYLDHNRTQVSLSTLELAKLPAITERPQ
jgi:integrase